MKKYTSNLSFSGLLMNLANFSVNVNKVEGEIICGSVVEHNRKESHQSLTFSGKEKFLSETLDRCY